MPIQPFRVTPEGPAEWGRFFRDTVVTPSDDSVDENIIKDGAVTEPKLGDDAVSTRTIVDDAVNDQRLRNSDGCSVIGRSANTTGDPADIHLGTDGDFLVRRAGVVQGSPILDGDMPATVARIADVSDAIDAHEAAPDPHPGYLTTTEGDARYRELTDAVTYAEITGKPAALALIFSGTGTPEGVVAAPVGSTFHRTDGGAGTSFYVKETGAATSSGWVGK